ncbi:MAG: lipid-A-disaccharide synthase [Deltaproteobacteria bacterium RIFOXYA12_FULL_58_15]|nr:MAG: lipid-A-disaccharide synthase [Deltaproteobacteria bacterium RIFOXYA12_FULL_58_15]OGR11371.1 MAG: lipid-A-disaccharide synthase [Deltaproteobacteria bacterium RIFOXYB12_FULL_58_9]
MQSPISILIVAGEASADAHGARVLAAIRQRRPDVEIFGIGGKAMREEGLDTIATAEDISVAGLTEVIFALPRLWGIMRRLMGAARERKPRVAILLDLPDFNLRVAKKLKKLDIPVVYYISPQIWAWRQGRVNTIRDLVAQMLVVLPFEQTFYQEHGVRVRFVGHPLVEQLPKNPDRKEARIDLGLPPTQGPIVALLPGSRRQEVSRHLPLMLEGIHNLRRRFPEVHAIIPVASTISRKMVEAMVHRSGLLATVIDGHATEALVAADAAVVCSGTATLQAALLSRPMVVVYRVSWLSFLILKRMVKVAHIALVNLIAGQRLVPELIQATFTADNVEAELNTILSDPMFRLRLNQDFALVRRKLGGAGASQQVAEVALDYLPDAERSDIVDGDKKAGQLWA